VDDFYPQISQIYTDSKQAIPSLLQTYRPQRLEDFRWWFRV